MTRLIAAAATLIGWAIVVHLGVTYLQSVTP